MALSAVLCRNAGSASGGGGGTLWHAGRQPDWRASQPWGRVRGDPVALLWCAHFWPNDAPHTCRTARWLHILLLYICHKFSELKWQDILLCWVLSHPDFKQSCDKKKSGKKQRADCESAREVPNPTPCPCGTARPLPTYCTVGTLPKPEFGIPGERLSFMMPALAESCGHGVDGMSEMDVDTAPSVPACLNGIGSGPPPSSNGEAMGETSGARCVF